MSTNSTNKIKFGLKNAHVAKLTENANGTYTYDTPQALPGSVNLSLDSSGESEPFYADDIVYFRTTSNNGYTGTLELALVPDWFREIYLREILDSNGVLIESANITDPVYFALMFEFTGDKHRIRHVMFKCSVSRPGIASQTREATSTPVTESLNLTCDPLGNGMTKAKSTADVDSTVYSNWFASVYVPELTEDQLNGGAGTATLTALTIGSLTLDPTFDAGTTSYTTTTTESTDTISATAASGTAVAITVNGNSITNSSSATWVTGENVVRVTVSKNGCASTTYTVIVTKSGS